jgi:acid phosphatase (class A)
MSGRVLAVEFRCRAESIIVSPGFHSAVVERFMRSSVHALAMLLVSLIAAALAGCATGTGAAAKSAGIPEVAPGFLAGYLPKSALPDSLALLPPPPAAGSAAFAADEHAYRATRSLRDTPRWALAAQDANLRFPDAARTFSCALGAAITEEHTPRLYVLMRRSLVDSGLATYAAKDHYQRRRPFVKLDDTSCTPQDEPKLRSDGSYPSGHSAVGWTWALILAQLAPERTDPILQRGYAFGQSRVICGVHWQSDVTEGRVIGAGVVARLHADPTFRADLQAAKAELAAARQKGLKPEHDCAAEAAILTMPR